MTTRQSAKQFIAKNFPGLVDYRLRTSRMFEATDRKSYYDDWWFQFPSFVLEETDFVVFAGAMDYSNTKFQIFKVPTKYLTSNIDKIDVNAKGRVNLYIHIGSYDEIRKGEGVSFREFALN